MACYDVGAGYGAGGGGQEHATTSPALACLHHEPLLVGSHAAEPAWAAGQAARAAGQADASVPSAGCPLLDVRYSASLPLLINAQAAGVGSLPLMGAAG